MSATTLALVLQSFVLTAHPAAALSPPGLTVTASSSTSVGLQIFANANLMGTTNPTGTITFNAFSPDDTSCSSSIFTSAVPAGTSVNSARYTTTRSGTYRWIAAYSGDATYFPATSTCGQTSSTVVVSKAGTTINIAAPAPVGNTIHGRATLGGGYSPTGTITFSLAPPGDTFCASPVFTATVAVNGVGAYDSPPFTATVAGSYKWRASYNGDANSLANGPTPCLDPNAAVTVTTVTPPAPQSNVGVFRPSNGSWYFQGQPGIQWGTTGDVPVPADYNGDSKPDIAVFRPSTGTWYVQDQPGGQLGTSGDMPVPADYNGDSKPDIAVFRPSTGTWYVQDQPGGQLGTSGDMPVPADYNGDGKADLGVFRPSTGIWSVQGQPDTVWGVSGDVPVPADYDGDGHADMAVYRPSTGQWFVRSSVTGAGIVTLWGLSGDVPVPADYDGDSHADIAVYRPSTGQWFVRSSVTSAGIVTVWGTSGDVPVPADYNGDGKADLGVFRPSTGAWFIPGQPGGVWGYSTDIALPLPAGVRMSFF